MNEVARRKLATKPRGTVSTHASGMWQWSFRRYISWLVKITLEGKREPFLNFLYLSSMSTWLLCILFCPCDFFQDSSTGTGGIQKRELGRERSSHNKSNISFMNRIVCLPFQPPDSFFYLSIKFGSFVYFFFFFPSFFFCCIIAISINIWYKIFIVRDVNTDEISIILRVIISSLAAFFWKSLIVYFFLFFFFIR